MEKSGKTVTEKPEVVSMGSIVDTSLIETLARHSDLKEYDYLCKIGFKGAKCGEDRAVMIAKSNLMQADLKETLMAREKVKVLNQLISKLLKEEN